MVAFCWVHGIANFQVTSDAIMHIVNKGRCAINLHACSICMHRQLTNNQFHGIEFPYQ